jgi:hypothetical protein
MRALVVSLLLLAAMLLAGWGRAQGAQEELPPELRVPANDPRKGPRLEFVRGPAQCPDEKAFRRMVAVWLDGRDHLAADSPDVARVRLAWTPQGYVGTVEYTDAAGNTSKVTVTKEADHCPSLARNTALKVAKRVPPKPPPEPCPLCRSCPACAECLAPSRCPAYPPPPKPPWPMDLKVGLSAYGMMTWLLTPNVAPAIGVAVDARGEVISVAGEFRAVMPSRVIATERVTGAASSYPVELDVSQFSVLVVPCGRWKYFVGCAVAQAGFFLFKTSIQELDATAFGLGPRLGFEVPFAEERFAVFGFGEALFTPRPAGVRFTNPPPGEPEDPAANVRWGQPVGSVFFGVGVSFKLK